MKEVTTRYFCDRCGTEFKPYGRVDDIGGGYGVVAFRKQYTDIRKNVFAGVEDWGQDATNSTCAMVLCKNCIDELTAYLMNE